MPYAMQIHANVINLYRLDVLIYDNVANVAKQQNDVKKRR